MLRFSSFVLFIGLFCSPVMAADVYISISTGSDSTGTGAANAPYQTSTKAFTVNGVNNVYKFMDGTGYPSFTDVTIGTGSLTAWTTFQAEHDGGAIVSGLAMRDASTPLQSHIDVEGFKFSGTSQKQIYGDHLKFIRCSFKGGPSSGNNVNTVIGGNNNGSNLTRFVLIQDCWFYGPGGRYGLLIFNAENIVTRRITIRHEGGYTYDGSDPESGFALYNSSACDILNMNLVDNTTNYTAGWTQALYFIHNGGATPDHVVIGNNIAGFIIIGSKSVGMRSDATTSSSNTFTDGVVVNSEDFAFSWGSNDNTTATGNRLAGIRHNMGFASSGGAGGFGYFPSTGTGIITLTNVIVSSYTSGNDYNGVSVSSFVTFNNGGTTAGGVTSDPSLNGFSFPMRIESGSVLSTKGTSAGQIGPNIMTKLGADGTLWGDTNYNTDTGNALWPWPYEARIKTDFQETSPGWGFSASTETLTTYEWEILGNAIPASIYAITSGRIFQGVQLRGVQF